MVFTCMHQSTSSLCSNYIWFLCVNIRNNSSTIEFASPTTLLVLFDFFLKGSNSQIMPNTRVYPLSSKEKVERTLYIMIIVLFVTSFLSKIFVTSHNFLKNKIRKVLLREIVIEASMLKISYENKTCTFSSIQEKEPTSKSVL